MEPKSTPPLHVQRIIRFAMLAGVVMLGAVIAFLRTTGVVTDMGIDANRSPVAVALSIVVIATIAAIPLFHRLVVNAESGSRQFTLTIMGMAVCEAGAITGAVLWLLTGSWTMYAVGTGAFVVAMLWIVPPDEAGPRP